MTDPRRANSCRRNKLLKWLRAQARPCWVCGLGIPYGIVPHTHPEAFECDEIVPVSKGGSPYSRDNVDAAHRCCNNWRCTKTPQQVKAIRDAVIKQFGGYTSAQDFVQKARAVEHSVKAPIAATRVRTSTKW